MAARTEICHTRPGAVRAPTGGSGYFLALQILTRTGEHGQVGGYGLRWPQGTYVISARSATLIRVEIAPRSRTCLETTYGRSHLHRRAIRLFEIFLAPGIVLGRPGGRKRRPIARSQFSPSRARDPTKGERAVGRRLGPHGRIRTLPGANNIYKSRSARPSRWLRP